MDRLGNDSVFKAWGAIAATHFLDSIPDLRKPPDAQAYTGLYRRLARQLKTYGLEDPPVKQEKASPIGIIHSIVTTSAVSYNPKNRQDADLVILGFYFCL